MEAIREDEEDAALVRPRTASTNSAEYRRRLGSEAQQMIHDMERVTRRHKELLSMLDEAEETDRIDVDAIQAKEKLVKSLEKEVELKMGEASLAEELSEELHETQLYETELAEHEETLLAELKEVEDLLAQKQKSLSTEHIRAKRLQRKLSSPSVLSPTNSQCQSALTVNPNTNNNNDDTTTNNNTNTTNTINNNNNNNNNQDLTNTPSDVPSDGGGGGGGGGLTGLKAARAGAKKKALEQLETQRQANTIEIQTRYERLETLAAELCQIEVEVARCNADSRPRADSNARHLAGLSRAVSGSSLASEITRELHNGNDDEDNDTTTPAPELQQTRQRLIAELGVGSTIATDAQTFARLASELATASKAIEDAKTSVEEVTSELNDLKSKKSALKQQPLAHSPTKSGSKKALAVPSNLKDLIYNDSDSVGSWSRNTSVTSSPVLTTSPPKWAGSHMAMQSDVFAFEAAMDTLTPPHQHQHQHDHDHDYDYDFDEEHEHEHEREHEHYNDNHLSSRHHQNNASTTTPMDYLNGYPDNNAPSLTSTSTSSNAYTTIDTNTTRTSPHNSNQHSALAVREWLNTIGEGFGELYFPVFEEYGADTITELRELVDDDVDDLCATIKGAPFMGKPLHIRKIRRGLTGLRSGVRFVPTITRSPTALSSPTISTPTSSTTTKMEEQLSPLTNDTSLQHQQTSFTRQHQVHQRQRQQRQQAHGERQHLQQQPPQLQHRHQQQQQQQQQRSMHPRNSLDRVVSPPSVLRDSPNNDFDSSHRQHPLQQQQHHQQQQQHQHQKQQRRQQQQALQQRRRQTQQQQQQQQRRYHHQQRQSQDNEQQQQALPQPTSQEALTQGVNFKRWGSAQAQAQARLRMKVQHDEDEVSNTSSGGHDVHQHEIDSPPAPRQRTMSLSDRFNRYMTS